MVEMVCLMREMSFFELQGHIEGDLTRKKTNVAYEDRLFPSRLENPRLEQFGSFLSDNLAYTIAATEPF